MVWVILGTVGAAYAAVCLAVFFLQKQLIYFPSREEVATPVTYRLPFNDVTLKTADGLSLAAWYVPPPRADGPVVLQCHGNGGNISWNLDLAATLREAGVGVMLFDYRGYGRSEGSPDEQGTYRDARAAWDYLTKTLALPPERILLYGQSLGGGVASHLAEQVKPAGLILESTFTSLVDRGAESFWFLPVRLLARYRYPTIDRLAGLSCPVLILHSRSDEIVAFHHGRDLFAAAHEPKRFVELKGDHNNAFQISGDVFVHAVGDFARECIAPKPPAAP